MNENFFNDLNKNSKSEGEKGKKSLVPVTVEKEQSKKLDEENHKVYNEAFGNVRSKYRKSTKTHIFYMRTYLLFFFLGACIFACGKWGFADMSQKVTDFLLKSFESFPDFCVKLPWLVFGSFFVYAAGFTVYAPVVSLVYSAGTFLLYGIVSASVVYSYGTGLEVFLSLLLLGLICGACILLSSVSCGISEIASLGIGNVGISDGVLFSLLYWGYLTFNYFAHRGIFSLLEV